MDHDLTVEVCPCHTTLKVKYVSPQASKENAFP